jgi:hypothetical protein
MTESQANVTRFCARIIGPLFLIIGAVAIVRFDTIGLVIPAIFHDDALTFVTGLFTLIVGLVLFAAHHHWSGATAILVSLLGLFTILRGMLLMLAPEIAEALATPALHGGPLAWVAGTVSLLVGLWLTYAGWVAKRL